MDVAAIVEQCSRTESAPDYALVISATLDTSCALNFLMSDEEPDEDLIELVSLALVGRISLKVSEEAFHEVQRTADPDNRARRIARLEAFGRLTIPKHQESEREALAGRLHATIFPNAKPGSRTDERNRRDCRQLAAHKLIGRAVFVTRDQRLLQGATAAMQESIDVHSPRELVERVESQMAVAGLPSHPEISVRDADIERDESEIRRVLSPLASDYPEFDAWLTGALGKAGTRVRVGEYDGHVAAVALSQAKDSGVVKLSAFYIESVAQRAGLGGHLLWSELRTWAHMEGRLSRGGVDRPARVGVGSACERGRFPGRHERGCRLGRPGHGQAHMRGLVTSRPLFVAGLAI